MNHPLQKMFSSIPKRYDLINRIITLGLDTRWRKEAVRECLKDSPGKVLDLCTGTGGLAAGLLLNTTEDTSLYGADFSQPMLEEARAKIALQGKKRSCLWPRTRLPSPLKTTVLMP